jgi:hypothetical protein
MTTAVDNPGKGEPFGLKVVAALLGAIIPAILNRSWGLFTAMLTKVPGETGWQAVLTGFFGVVCLGIGVWTAYVTGWAYLYAIRYTDAQRHKDNKPHPQEEPL